MKARLGNDQIFMLVFLAALSFVVGLSVGANTAARDADKTLTVQDSEVLVTTPTTTKPVTYDDVVCDSEDEIAVVVTERAFDLQIGDRFCTHKDNLVPRS